MEGAGERSLFRGGLAAASLAWLALSPLFAVGGMACTTAGGCAARWFSLRALRGWRASGCASFELRQGGS